MSLYKTFATDTDLEKTGINLQFGLVDEDPSLPITIRIARAGGSNMKFAKVLEAKTKPHRRAIDTKTIDKKTADRLMLETFFESVVLGWENVTDQEGNLLEFNLDNFAKVMTDLPDLYDTVKTDARDASLFRQGQLEESAGN